MSLSTGLSMPQNYQKKKRWGNTTSEQLEVAYSLFQVSNNTPISLSEVRGLVAITLFEQCLKKKIKGAASICMQHAPPRNIQDLYQYV